MSCLSRWNISVSDFTLEVDFRTLCCLQGNIELRQFVVDNNVIFCSYRVELFKNYSNLNKIIIWKGIQSPK